MEFGYWGIKGLGEPIRWVIAHLGLQVNEFTPATPEEWFGQKKPSLGLDFPNLPYLVDGDFKLTESSAIPVYLIHKAGKQELLGSDAKQQAQVRQIEGVLGDIRQELFKVFFVPADHAAAAAKAFEPTGKVVQKIEQLSKFLGTKDFLLGHVTLADLLLTYHLHLTESLAKSFNLASPWAAHQNLVDLSHRVTKLPGVHERFEASKGVPFMPPTMLPFKMLTTAECEAAK